MPRTLSLLVFLAACSSSPVDPVPVPLTVPDCATAQPAEVIVSSGCTDIDGEWQAVAVFTCDGGRLLYGIGNRWAFAGDATWTVGGQALWDLCRPDR